jgi:hypothetical protein
MTTAVPTPGQGSGDRPPGRHSLELTGKELRS